MRCDRTRVLTAGAAVAAVAMTASGCGSDSGSGRRAAGTTAATATAATGSGSPARALARAVRVTSGQKGGLAFRMDAVVDTAGTRTPVSATGAVDRVAGRGTMRITAGSGGQRFTADEVTVGRVIYVHSDELAGRLPGGKAWMKVDLDAPGGLDLSGLGGGPVSQNPAQFLDYVRGAEGISVLGTEDVHGVRTTRYNVVIDPRKALARAATPGDRAALKRTSATLRGRTIPADVYVDDHGLVRREHLGLAVEKRGRSASIEMTIDFTGFGVPVRAAAPDAGDVIDASRLSG